MPEVACHVCETLVWRSPSALASQERTFCSRTCQGKWRSTQTGPDGANWRGGVRLDHGRVTLYRPDHHLGNGKGYVYRYQLVAESMLGRKLLPGEVVHHEDLNDVNDDPSNLVVYPNQAEHARHHGKLRSPEMMARMRAARGKSRDHDTV